MRIRPTLVAAVVTCALAAAPALATAPSGHHAGTPHRVLHPRDSSGGGPVTVVAPRTTRHPRTTTTGRVRWRVAPGVTYTQWQQTDRRGTIDAHLLTVDPSTPGLRIDYASRETVRQVGTVADLVAGDGGLAGVNGDFYDIGHTGAPMGLGADRRLGVLHGRADGWNNAFYLDRRGRPRIGELPMTAGIRRHRELHLTNLNSPYVVPGGIGVYTSAWGRTAGYRVTEGQHRHVRAVLVQRGRVVRNVGRLPRNRPIEGILLIGRGASAALLRDRLPVGARARTTWSLAHHPRMAISGNLFLIRDGVLKPIDDRVLAPRTAVGIDADTGEVLLLVVDGRTGHSRGYTMVELAELMADLGADDAINLDGGGSSTMVGRDQAGVFGVLNTPSDGFARRVADAIAISYRRPPGSVAAR